MAEDTELEEVETEAGGEPEPTAEDQEDELLIGIDVGTQNTIGLFSDGETEVVKEYSSIVGFPKNDLSRQKLEDILGRPVAFDDEVYDKNIVQNIEMRWPLKTFDEQYDGDQDGLSEEDRETLNTVVQRVLNEEEIENNLEESPYLRIAIATPSTTALEYNQNLIDYARRNLPEEARPSFLIESESHFAGYKLAQLDGDLGREGVIVVDIGAGTTDFHVYDGNPSDNTNTHSLATAGNDITDRLFELLQDSGYQNTWQEVESIKQEYGRIEPSANPPRRDPELVISDLRYQGRDNVRADIGPEMEKAHRPLLKELVDGYKDLMNEYTGPLPQNVVLVGNQGQVDGLKEAFQKTLNEEKFSVDVRNLADFDISDPNTFVAKGALERIKYTPYKQLAH